MKELVQDGWYEYEKGVVLRLDTSTGQATRELEYESPPDVRPVDDPPVLFKSGSLQDGLLYLCTQTEVLIYEVPAFRLKHYISLPQFNDVHHVRPSRDGHLLVANTGLDMVMKLDHDGGVVQEWDVLEGPLWSRFSRHVDYRRVRTTKPHLAHPNHVFELDSGIWATRFEQRDAVCLNDSRLRIDIGLERVHDGIVAGENIYFTTVDGKVVIAQIADLSIREVVDLAQLEDTEELLGWCRGILADGHVLWVGFSRIRPTRFRENVAWVRNRFKQPLGTHVACYDLQARKCVGRFDTEASGLNAIFGIYAPSSVEAAPVAAARED